MMSTSAAADIERWQRELVLITPRTPSDVGCGLVKQISEACRCSPPDSADTALICSTLLNSDDDPPDLLSWLVSTVEWPPSDSKKVKMAALECVRYFLGHLGTGQRVDAYAIRIQGYCLRIFRSETGSDEIRAHALRLLRTLLKLGAESLSPSGLWREDAEAIFTDLFDRYNWSGEMKLGQKVKGEILKLLGLMVCIYASRAPSILQYLDKILGRCDSALEQNFRRTSKRPEMYVISGALACLDLCIKDFPAAAERYSASGQRSGTLFVNVFKGINSAFHQDNYRYAVSCKSLRLLSHHPELFSESLGKQSSLSNLLPLLEKCFLSDVKRLKKYSPGALQATLRQVSLIIATTSDSQESSSIFEFYTATWRDELRKTCAEGAPVVTEGTSADNSFKEWSRRLSIPVIGLGMFVSAAPDRRTARDVLNTLMAQVSRLEASGPADAAGKSIPLTVRAHFMVAIARAYRTLRSHIAPDLSIIRDIAPDPMELLMRMCGVAIDQYHSYEGDHPAVEAALQELIFSLGDEKTMGLAALETFLQGILPAAIALASTRLGPGDDERLCFIFANMWSKVLSGNSLSPETASRAYDALLRNLLGAFRKLNLSYHGGVVNEALTASNPIDQELFLNMVTFCELLFGTVSRLSPHLLATLMRWVPPMSELALSIGSGQPFVSANYRLLTVLFRLCDEADYFKAPEDPLVAEALRCFVQRSALQASSQFADELLAACLRMIVSVPLDLVVPAGNLGLLVPSLRQALALGTSDAQTGAAALDALDRWRAALSKSELDAHLPNILPALDPYLLPLAATRQAGTSMPRGWKAGRRGHGFGEDGAESKALQQRVMRFLGNLDGQSHALVIPAEDAVGEGLAWDLTPRLGLRLPRMGERGGYLEIFLDSAIPRVVELAEQSGAGQSKALAAECLHSLIIFMVGQTATDPRSGRQGRSGDFHRLFRRVFPAVRRLAVDVDVVTRRLFEPLLFQLIHWFSNAEGENPDARALVDSLMEGMSGEDGSGKLVRAVCARGILEFLSYGIRQRSKKQLAESDVALHPLLMRIFNLAVHPDPQHRIGAALVLCSLYSHLREETSLLERYGLQLLHVSLVSLQRSHADHEALGTSSAAVVAVEHARNTIKRAILEWNDRAGLLRESRVRSFPGKLSEMVSWVWDHVGAEEFQFRRACMECFESLSPLVMHAAHPAGTLNEPHKSGGALRLWVEIESAGRIAAEVDRVCEAGFVDSREALFGRGPRDVRFGRLKGWLGYIASSCHSFHWVVTRNIISCESFLRNREGSALKRKWGDEDESHSSVEGAHILHAVSAFLQHYGSALPSDARSLLKSYQDCQQGAVDGSDWTVMEISTLQGERRRALQRAADLLHCIVDKNSLVAIPALVTRGLWSNAAHRLMLQSLLCPWAGGLLSQSLELSPSSARDALPSAVERMLGHWRLLDAAVPPDAPKFESCVKSLTMVRSRCSSNGIDCEVDLCVWCMEQMTTPSASGGISSFARQVLRAYHTLHRLGLLDGQSLAASLGRCALSMPDNASPDSVEVMKNAFRFASATLGLPPAPSGPIDEQPFSNVLGCALLSGGSIFYRRFQAEVNEALLRDAPTWKQAWIYLRSVCPKNGEAQTVLCGALSCAGGSWPLTSQHCPAIVVAEIMFDGLEQLLRGVTQSAAVIIAEDVLGLLPVCPSSTQLEGVGKDILNVVCAFCRDVIQGDKTTGLRPSAGSKVDAIKRLVPLIIQRAQGWEIGDSVAVHDIRTAVEHAVSSHFPVRSSEVGGMPLDQEREYTELLGAILRAAVSCSSADLLGTLFGSFQEGEAHSRWKLIKGELKEFVRVCGGAGSQRAQGVCCTCLDVILQPDVNANIQFIMCEMICIRVIRRMSTSALLDLLVQRKQVSGLVEAAAGADSLGTRACAFLVLEAVLDVLPPKAIKDGLVKVEPSCKAFHKECIGAALRALTISGDGTSQRLRQSAFVCLCTAVRVTQTNEPNFNKYVWSTFMKARASLAIVSDPLAKVKLSPRERKPTSISISGADGKFLRRERSLQSTGSELPAGQSLVTYSTSTYANAILSNSSLSIQAEAEGGHQVEDATEFSIEDDQALTQGVIKMELSVLSREPCMPALLRVVSAMSHLFGRSWKDRLDSESDFKPEWVRQLIHHLEDDTECLHARLLMLQLILNDTVAESLAPWAARGVVRATLSFCISHLFDKSFCEGFHWLLVSVCQKLLGPWQFRWGNWSEISRDLASSFISSIIGVFFAPGVSQPDLRAAISYIDKILTLCDPADEGELQCMPISTEGIHSLLNQAEGITGGAHARQTSPGSVAALSVLSGLRLLQVLLAHRVPVFAQTNPLASSIAYDVLRLIGWKKVEVYKEAAYLCGLAASNVKQLVRANDEADGGQNWLQSLSATVSSQFQGGATEKFVKILRGISQNYKEVLTRDITLQVLASIPRLEHTGKAAALQILQLAPDHPDVEPPIPSQIWVILRDLLGDTRSEYFPADKRWLPTVQLGSLQLLRERLLPHLDGEALEWLLGSLVSLGMSPTTNVETREEVFRTLLDLLRLPSAERFAVLIRRTLLFGLLDPDDLQIRNKSKGEGDGGDEEEVRHGVRGLLFNYWMNSPGAESATSLLEQLMTDMYDRSIAGGWLQYACVFMLELALKSQESSAKLFTTPLGDCKFKEVDISQTGNLSGNAPLPMEPMFSLRASSLSSQSQDFAQGTQSDDVDVRTAGFLRATQGPNWAATQSLAPIVKSFTDRERAVKSSGGPQMDGGAEDRENVINQSMPPPASVQRHQLSGKPKLTQTKGTILYRRYREGELPDTDISLKDLLRPMQQLASRDAPLASHLFTEIFRVVFDACGPEYGPGPLTFAVESMLVSCPSVTELVTSLHTACSSTKTGWPRLPHSVVAESGLRSLSFHSAILLLETQQLRGVENSPNLSLGRLYAEIDRREIAAELQNTGVECGTHSAVLAESEGRFDEAFSKYSLRARQISEAGGSKEEMQVIDQRMLDCMLQLGQWTSLERALEGAVKGADQVDKLWGDAHSRDILLPYYISSLASSTDIAAGDSLVLFIDRAAKDTANIFAGAGSSTASLTKMEWLRERAPVELARACLLKGDMGRTTGAAQTCFDSFIRQWSGLPRCATEARRRILRLLQPAAELEDFASFCRKPDNLTDSDAFLDLLKRWDSHIPSKVMDPMPFWNSMVAQRIACLRHVQRSSAPSSAIEPFKLHLAAFMLEGARAGVHQGVLPAAEAFIRRCDKLLGVTGPPDLCLSLCITKLEYNKAKLTRVSTESEESDIVSRSLSLLDSVLGVNGLTVEGNLRAELLLADGWWRERKGRGALTKVIQESYTGAVEVPDSNGKVYAQAYLRLAELAEGAGEVAAAIQHSLCAVTADPTLGLGCIGKVIHLLGKSEAASSVFLDASKSVPLWTFLPWVSQFLAMLTQPARSRNVVSFLEKMAEEYPQALFFPVRVSKVSFGEREMRLSGPLLQRVANPSLEAFSEALLGLDNPELRFFTGMRLVKRLMDEKEESRAKSEAERLLSECLSSSRTGLGGNIGTYNKNFAQRNHAEEFRTDLIDAPSLQGSNVNKWLKKASEWKSKMSSRVEVADLALFSGWLAEYDPCKHSIEVPGQYAEQMVSPPRVEYHAKITGFSKEVLVMQSLRRPKRLTIYASDGTAKAFLVKGGEDLRLDERIQRIFCAMNSSFQDDPACARARLRVNTINVVPLSPRLGMIEWVKNSLPLKAVMKSQVGDDVDRSSAPFYKLMRNDMSAEKFHRLFTKGQDYVVPTYRSCRDAVPRGILRSHLLAMGPSAEVFITLRDTFVKSLSVFNICSYVAGVGDRHLENFLIQEQTGAIVGIDFGAAFGHATTTLPVPELIPFRLTPQFSSVMTPLKTTLLMEHYMLSSLRALQCNSSVIVDMLDVFIAEPIVDWTGGVAVVFGEQKGGESGLQEAGSLSTARAEISLKVLSSRRKLQGWHPAALIEDDLSRNSYVEKYRTLDQLSLAVWADDRPERGSWMKEGCSKRLSPEDQIARLISIASDENVLGRSWVGLKTWL